MLENIKKIFMNKEKKVENLISFLIILIITVIVINKILNSEESSTSEDYKNEIGVELASGKEEKSPNDLEKRLENILNKISGVGNVSVLLTYKESGSIIPIYNINSSTSTEEEKDSSGKVKTIETENIQKDVITSSGNDIVIEKNVMPIVEGAIITAERSKWHNS